MWSHIRITDDTLPVTFFAETTKRDAWLFSAKNQVRMMLCHSQSIYYRRCSFWLAGFFLPSTNWSACSVATRERVVAGLSSLRNLQGAWNNGKISSGIIGGGQLCKYSVWGIQATIHGDGTVEISDKKTVELFTYVTVPDFTVKRLGGAVLRAR